MKPAVCLSVAEFCHAVKTNRIFTALDDAFAADGRWVAPNERQSWQGSLPRLSGALELASLPDSTYIGLECCVYAHNYPSRTGALFDTQYSDVMLRAPVFCATDAEALAEFLKARLSEDRGVEIMDRVRQEGLGPSKILTEQVSRGPEPRQDAQPIGFSMNHSW